MVIVYSLTLSQTPKQTYIYSIAVVHEANRVTLASRMHVAGYKKRLGSKFAFLAATLWPKKFKIRHTHNSFAAVGNALTDKER